WLCVSSGAMLRPQLRHLRRADCCQIESVHLDLTPIPPERVLTLVQGMKTLGDRVDRLERSAHRHCDGPPLTVVTHIDRADELHPLRRHILSSKALLCV